MELRWDLDDILKVEDFDTLYFKIESKFEKIDDIHKTLDPEMSTESFKELLDFNDTLANDIYRLWGLPEMMETTDQKSTQAKLLKGRAKDLYIKLADISRKTSHWLKGFEAVLKGIKQ